MRTKSIIFKVISSTSAIMFCSFVVVIFVIVYFSVLSSQLSLKSTESDIYQALMSKGEAVTMNSVQAMTVFVEDYAFFSIQEMVKSVVDRDQDIIFGIYMDAERKPWIYHSLIDSLEEVALNDSLFINTKELPEGGVDEEQEGKEVQDEEEEQVVEVLNDQQSIWIAGHTEYSSIEGVGVDNGKAVRYVEFFSPIWVAEEIVGFVRYGISTKSIEQALFRVEQQSQRALTKTVSGIVFTAFASFLLMFLFLKGTVKKILLPLKSLSELANSISKGDYELSVQATTNDELGVLADGLENMRVNIKNRLTDLIELNKMGQIVSVMEEEEQVLEVAGDVLVKQFGASTGLFVKVSDGSVYLDDIDGFNIIKIDAQCESLTEEKKVVCDDKALSFTLWKGVGNRDIDQARFTTIFSGVKISSWTTSQFLKLEGDVLLYMPLIEGDDLIGAALIKVDDVEKTAGLFALDFVSSVADQLMKSLHRIRAHQLIRAYNETLEVEVKARTHEVVKKNKDIAVMLQTMELGLFTIDSTLTVQPEYSNYLTKILSTEQIAERNFLDLIAEFFDFEEQKLNEIRSVLISFVGEDEINFDLNSHLLPRSASILVSGNVKLIDIEWNPIIIDEVVEHLMVTLRDVTKVRELERQAEERQHEIDRIVELIDVPAKRFQAFIQEVDQLILETGAKFSAVNDLDSLKVAVNASHRVLHTVKGNSRSYGLKGISSQVHHIEAASIEHELPDEAQLNTQRLEAERSFYLERLEHVNAVVEQYQHLAHERLNYHKVAQGGEVAGKDAGDMSGFHGGLSGDLKPLEALFEQLMVVQREQKSVDEGYIQASQQVVAHYLMVPLSELLAPCMESLEDIAQQLGKPKPSVRLQGLDQFYVHRRLRSTLFGAFNHLLRNAIDHSIEPELERSQQGKCAAGEIHIALEQIKGQHVLVVKDDGRGLNLRKLWGSVQGAMTDPVVSDNDNQHSSNSQSSPNSQNPLNSLEKRELTLTDLLEHLFTSGVSTADQVSDISGRGVGLDAVRVGLREMGGDIELVPDTRFNPGMGVEVDVESVIEKNDYLPIKFFIKLPSLTTLRL